MSDALVRLSLAIGDYDHVRDLVAGAVRADGIDLAATVLPAPELFARFTRTREWDVAEMSLGMYVAMLSRGDTSLTALPVFPSRMFRHGAIFVRRGGGIDAPADLAGRRIGFPDWTHTAGIWARALLAHEYGVPLDGIAWVQAGLDRPGFVARPGSELPANLRHEPVQERDLDTMLREGAIDAIISAHTPPGARGDDPQIVRLLPDRAVEEEYYLRTRIFPIMHVVCVRRDALAAAPAAAASLFAAFSEARARSITRLRDTMVSHFPLPWMAAEAARARSLFGDDIWPYGVGANRATLTAFLRYAREQGVAARDVALEELFPDTVLST